MVARLARIVLSPAFAAGLCLLLAACGHHDRPAPAVSAPATTPAPRPLSQVALIGRQLFYDTSLSSSGQLSCASCHDPAHAFAPANELSVQLGGPHLHTAGQRAVPSLAYKIDTPNFTVGPDTSADVDARLQAGMKPVAPADTVHATPQGALARIVPTRAKAGNPAAATALVPQGGLFWDGRADTLQGQALGPLLNPLEMDNPDPDVLVDRLRKVAYGGQLQQLFGPNVLRDKRLLVSEALFAISRYEQEETAFHAYSSKYDAYLAGRAELTPQEQHGLKLFEDPQKGNCAACHPSRPSRDSRPPQFTDFQFEALGVPRNKAIPANADPAYFDLGICGPARHDSYAQQASNCGLFKTPTLRNVATRHAFFHNGVFHSLADVLHFYVARDTDPGKFYPRGKDGAVEKFDDLPARYRRNVDTLDAPLDRHPGDRPALDEAEIGDVIAFLKTLNDGYRAP